MTSESAAQLQYVLHTNLNVPDSLYFYLGLATLRLNELMLFIPMGEVVGTLLLLPGLQDLARRADGALLAIGVMGDILKEKVFFYSGSPSIQLDLHHYEKKKKKFTQARGRMHEAKVQVW